MLSTGIKNLKNNLSRCLLIVKKGQDVLITERGKVIARIIKDQPNKKSVAESLRPLVVKGMITIPTRQIAKDIPDPLEISGKPVSEMVIEDRR